MAAACKPPPQPLRPLPRSRREPHAGEHQIHPSPSFLRLPVDPRVAGIPLLSWLRPPRPTMSLHRPNILRWTETLLVLLHIGSHRVPWRPRCRQVQHPERLCRETPGSNRKHQSSTTVALNFRQVQRRPSPSASTTTSVRLRGFAKYPTGKTDARTSTPAPWISASTTTTDA